MTIFHLLDLLLPLTLACLVGKLTTEQLSWEWAVLTVPAAALLGLLLSRTCFLLPLWLVRRRLRSLSDSALCEALCEERWVEAPFVCAELFRRQADPALLRDRLQGLMHSPRVPDKAYIIRAALHAGISLVPAEEQR